MVDDSSDEIQGTFSTGETATLPPGWRITRQGAKSAEYAYGSNLSHQIEPRFHQSETPGQSSQITYRVILWKRIYAYQPVGEPTILGTTETFDDAKDLANEYMAEFVTNRQQVSMKTRADLETDPILAPNAEKSILRKAAITASTEVAGYSDERVVKNIRELLELRSDDTTVLQAVVHRHGAVVETVFVAEGCEDLLPDGPGQPFVHRPDSSDTDLLQSETPSAPSVMIDVFDETRRIRFPAGAGKETVIFLHPDCPVHLPYFERTVGQIVSAKWAESEGTN